MKVVVAAYDPAWPSLFENEAAVLAAALGSNAIAIHHIGSTSIPGMSAKPIIDIMVEAEQLSAVDAHNAEMARIGYEAMGEFGIAGRRYFRRHDHAGTRSHHVHVFQRGSEDADRHLALRDYLRTNPDDVQRYSDLKLALAQAHPNDIEAYMDGKDALVKEIEAKALLFKQH